MKKIVVDHCCLPVVASFIEMSASVRW